MTGIELIEYLKQLYADKDATIVVGETKDDIYCDIRQFMPIGDLEITLEVE